MRCASKITVVCSCVDAKKPKKQKKKQRGRDAAEKRSRVCACAALFSTASTGHWINFILLLFIASVVPSSLYALFFVSLFRLLLWDVSLAYAPRPFFCFIFFVFCVSFHIVCFFPSPSMSLRCPFDCLCHFLSLSLFVPVLSTFVSLLLLILSSLSGLFRLIFYRLAKSAWKQQMKKGS